MCPRATQTCEICEKVVSKYKCPSCLVPYCSLACFKIHKETPCAKPSSTEEKPAASPTIEVPVEANDLVEKTRLEASAFPAKEVPVVRPINVEEEKYVVEKLQLESIASSSEIREALKDEALQKIICNIDSSSNPLQELDAAMGVKAFCVFTDKIISNISKSIEEQ